MQNKFRPPVVKKMTLRYFSLYSKEPIITTEFNEGVFCLAGANGLGKSTFLLALNYGITGLVPDPKHRFQSVEQYYKDSLSFSSRFFDGRISEADRNRAEVTLEMVVGNHVFIITRGMFAPKELRQLIVRSTELDRDFGHLNAKDRHKTYTEMIAEYIGLDTFEQLVFLQHFVFTFDERRELLFWNKRALERALYLAFGESAEEAQRADQIGKEREDAESRARNLNWQATQVRYTIQEIERKRKGIATPDSALDPKVEGLKREHVELTQRRQEEVELVYQSEGELRDLQLRISELSAQQAEQRAEYEGLFAVYVHRHSALAYHPLIAESIRGSKCGLCGSEGPNVAAKIAQAAHSDMCPLCGSQLTEESEETKQQQFERLQIIDAQLADTRASLDQALAAKIRVTSELDASKSRLVALDGELAAFERANKMLVDGTKVPATGESTEMNILLQRYYAEMNELIQKKDQAYELRDIKGRELAELQRGLERQYLSVEKEFVPSFKQLANSFLGLDLDVRMESQKGVAPHVTLLLEVCGTERRQLHHLSESQRFFVDIALRMALAQYTHSPGTSATLYIDTPEGSLDIAYESRAGDMFAQFVRSGHNIIMTANINTSQLLKRLAERCGKSKMRLQRMTSWTDLSQVQIQEQQLFEQAYEGIETSLTTEGQG